MKTHELKTLPEYFDAVASGRKAFEIRKNDRNFECGDFLVLEEWTKETGYTGRALQRVATFITDFEQKPGFVVMSIAPLRDISSRLLPVTNKTPQ